ncbi:MAG: DUF6008 family protein [Sporichthyaceae bacterium]
MQHRASSLDVAGAIALLVVAVAMWSAILILVLSRRREPNGLRGKACVTVILVGIAAQLGHLQEHVAQVCYWVQHPNSPAWMTPWGESLARGFGSIHESTPMLGMEILHFVGNMGFLAGIVGIVVITRDRSGSDARRWARMGTWMQGLHGLEHLALMVSVALGTRAIGLSTWFGLMNPGPGLWTYRIWWHFVANVIGSVIFSIALRHLWRERADVLAGFRNEPSGPAHAAPGDRPPAGVGSPPTRRLADSVRN